MSIIIDHLIPYFQRDKCRYRIEEYGYLAQVRHPQGSRPFFVRGMMSGLQSSAIAKVLDDKIYTKKLLTYYSISTPSGMLVISRASQFFNEGKRRDALNFADRIGFPLIRKPLHGSLGDGVVLVEDIQQLMILLKQADTLSPHHMIEQYIQGKEYRVTMVDGEILFSYEKIGENIVKNIAKGSKMHKYNLSSKEVKRVKQVSKLFGLKTAGFDIISIGTIDQGTILEINASPGLKGLSLLSHREQQYFREKMWESILKSNGIK